MLKPKAIILRHRKENKHKCSLTGLEEAEALSFYSYPLDSLPDIKGSIYLSLEGEELSINDRGSVIFLIDSTWRYQKKIERVYAKKIDLCLKRTLPRWIKTAYPRRQTDCDDTMRGLASCEALFSAFTILKEPANFLLEHYYFREQFLTMNHYEKKA